MARKREKLRGIYEDPRGSNIWWIQYFDAQRRRHREKVGRREAAINLLAIRRSAKLEGRKLPSPRQAILFRALCADALEHSRAENLGDHPNPAIVISSKPADDGLRHTH